MLFQIEKYRLLIKSRSENELILKIYRFINVEFTRLNGLYRSLNKTLVTLIF